MFDIGWSEMALIAVVALVVIGPKELPGVLRTVGYWMKRARTLAAEFQSGIEEMAREAELSELRKEMAEAARKAEEMANAEPEPSIGGDAAAEPTVPRPEIHDEAAGENSPPALAQGVDPFATAPETPEGVEAPAEAAPEEPELPLAQPANTPPRFDRV